MTLTLDVQRYGYRSRSVIGSLQRAAVAGAVTFVLSGNTIAVAQDGIEVTASIPPDTLIMTPGAGWAGAPETPDLIGDGEGVGATRDALCMLDCVPFQTIGGSRDPATLNIGIPAFHLNSGISNVSYGVDGGESIVSTYMAPNPDTANQSGIGQTIPVGATSNVSSRMVVYNGGVIEYFRTLDSAEFAGDGSDDGEVEVRATVNPVKGQPRILSVTHVVNNNDTYTGQIIWCDSVNGSDSNDGLDSDHPKQTLMAAVHALSGSAIDGARVYLLDGAYTSTDDSSPNTYDAKTWLVVMPAPGVDRENVSINCGGNGTGIECKKLCYRNVTLSESFFNPQSGTRYLWLNGCRMSRTRRIGDTGHFAAGGGWAGLWITDCTITGGWRGPAAATLVRNCVLDDIVSDIFTSCNKLVNCIVLPGAISDEIVGPSTTLAVNASNNLVVDVGSLFAEANMSYNADKWALRITGGTGWSTTNGDGEPGPSYYTIVSGSGTELTLTTSPGATGITGGQGYIVSLAHPDVQGRGDEDNTDIFYYGLELVDYGAGQGLTASGGTVQPFTNVAIVGVNIDHDNTYINGLTFKGTTTNMYILNSGVTGGTLCVQQVPYTSVDVVIENCEGISLSGAVVR